MSREIPATEKLKEMFTNRCKHRKTIFEHPNCFLHKSNLRSLKKEELKTKPQNQLVELNKVGDLLLKKLSSKKLLVKAPPFHKIFKGKIEESACLVLSDVHYGKINYGSVENQETQIVTYSPEICVREMDKLIDSIFDINKYLSGWYNLKKLYIFAVGDLIDNQLVYRGQEWFVQTGVLGQLTEAIDVFQSLFKQLLTMYPEIEVIVVGGNHGRITSRPQAEPFYNNFDYTIGKLLQKYFASEKRITFTLPESWLFVKHIYDWKYVLHHGNTIRSWLGLPYYGIQRSSKSLRGEIQFDLEVIGHFHQAHEIPICSTASTLINGGWIEQDDFALRQYKIFSKPAQWYFGLSEKRPRTWCYKLDLRVPSISHKEGDS